MNNGDVHQLLQNCKSELAQIQILIQGLGVASNIVPYLAKYSLIKACGTVEIAYKQIVADKCSYRCNRQVKKFLEKRVNRNSANPSYERMCDLLKSFDEDWCTAFKLSIRNHAVSSLRSSLESLVESRNEFAHGGNPHISIGSVIAYFDDAIIVLQEYDHVVGG